MLELVRGQKVKLSVLTASPQLEVGLSIASRAGQVIDISAFGLDVDDKLSDDRYFIFYNQKSSPCGSLVSAGSLRGDQEVFRIDLSRLPPSVRKVVFTATFDSAGRMADVGASHLRLFADGRQVARFAFSGADFGTETAVMVAELYRSDVWRFWAEGQGFAGGLSALLAHFGGEEAEPTDTTPARSPAAPAPPPQRPPAASPAPPAPARVAPAPPAPTPPAPARVAPTPPAPAPPAPARVAPTPPTPAPPAPARVAPTPPAPAPAPPAPPSAAAASRPPRAPAAKPRPRLPRKVSLGKITLEERGARQAIDLETGGPLGDDYFRINLSWGAPSNGQVRSVFGMHRKATPIDLDLGCFYRLTDGSSGVIQPLSGYGARDASPYIILDKGKDGVGGHLTLARPDLIERVLIFTLIYEGTSNFAQVNGRLTVEDETGTEILIRLDNPVPSLPFCAVCLIERKGDRLEIVKEEHYFAGHRPCDEQYGFGLRWTGGGM